jgi:NAD(P)-dependent dehydrogenase (short-subunit alcohol dehydrogenase family)
MTDGQARVVAVTGASRGIGAHTAAELARRGYTVAALSRKGVGLEEFVVDDDAAQRIFPFACDVADDAARREAMAEVIAELGRLDALVNNAGQHSEGPSATYDLAEFDRLMSTNVTSAFAMSQLAYPHLKASRGQLIFMGSYYDKLGVRFHAAYSATKAAIAAVGRTLAVEWARDGIRVVTVAPGFIATDLNKRHRANPQISDYMKSRIPTGEHGTPAEVAKLVAGILDENLSFLTGETIYLDGGQAVNN